jgi:Icc-related predicted phosphoesterase
MIIDCIADLHGYYPELEGGDLLIVAGDMTARHSHEEYLIFLNWMRNLNYKKKIFIAGNHDQFLQKFQDECFYKIVSDEVVYLQDCEEEFEGLKIWGSPWTLTFPGMNPHCKAFTVDTEEELAEKWALIPDDVDILITHGPPFGILDKTDRGECVGSRSLAHRIGKIDDGGDGRKRLHIFGHIHEAYGGLDISNPIYDRCTWKMINCSHVNERYEPVNAPIRIIL